MQSEDIDFRSPTSQTNFTWLGRLLGLSKSLCVALLSLQYYFLSWSLLQQAAVGECYRVDWLQNKLFPVWKLSFGRLRTNLSYFRVYFPAKGNTSKLSRVKSRIRNALSKSTSPYESLGSRPSRCGGFLWLCIESGTQTVWGFGCRRSDRHRIAQS